MAGTTVTIAQRKGGVGKTTLAAHLAVAWAQDPNRSVALLDLDPQGSLGEWFERREARLGEDRTGLTFRTASGWGLASVTWKARFRWMNPKQNTMNLTRNMKNPRRNMMTWMKLSLA